MIDGSRGGSNSSCTAFAGLLQQCRKVELECVEGLSVVPLEKDVVRNGLSSACCAVLCCRFYYHRISYRAMSTRADHNLQLQICERRSFPGMKQKQISRGKRVKKRNCALAVSRSRNRRVREDTRRRAWWSNVGRIGLMAR